MFKMTYKKEKVKSSRFFVGVNNPGPWKGNSRKQRFDCGNLSDYGLFLLSRGYQGPKRVHQGGAGQVSG
jgi:hypothetical protein